LKEQKIRLTIDDFPTTYLAAFTSKSEDDRIENISKWLNDYEKQDYDLLLGAYLVEQIRKNVKEQTGFFCSAGVARNKILAKLCCGFNKPRRQTVLTPTDVDHVFDRTPVQKM